MKFYNKFLAFIGLGMLAAENQLPTKAETPKGKFLPKKPKKRIVPKGAMYFHFNTDGVSTIADFPLDDTVFSCIARTQKRADFKFSRWDDHRIEEANNKKQNEN